MNTTNPTRISRREAIKWVLTAAASTLLFHGTSFATGEGGIATTGGYGKDPDLLKTYKPGDFWPLVMNDEQRHQTAVLCDVIIPADEGSPSASALGVHDFINEWVSAPYRGHDNDRKNILAGFVWLDQQAEAQFSKKFVNLSEDQKRAICDEIAFEPKTKPDLVPFARFFSRFRELTLGGFYTTPEGMKDMGYTGNVPSVTFDGPTPEILKKVGLI